MANDLKGEVRFEVDGTAYKMRFTTNALYEHLEKPLGMKFTKILDDFDKTGVSVGAMRQIMYAGLVGSHKELTLEETGDLIDALGFAETTQILTEAFLASFGVSSKKKKRK